jgi:hypothetical protein
MQKRKTAWLIYVVLVLASAATVLSSAGHSARIDPYTGPLMRAPAISNTAFAAGALEDLRYLEVPPQ